ncbi:hypothetical protein ACQ4PT_053927 [Festuca glaucescens]
MSSRPFFVATASGTCFLGGGQLLLGLGDGGLLDYSRPVASWNGRLVPVCNIVVLLPLIISAASKNNTTVRNCGYALLTGHDLRPSLGRSFIRLLVVYNRNHGGSGASTMLRCYSSDTGRWGPEAESDVKIHSPELCTIGQAVVRHGAAFWALDHGVLGVRLDQTDQDAVGMDVHLVPYHTPYYWPNNRLLGVSPDNRLFFIYVGVMARPNMIMVAKLSYFEFDEEDDIRTGHSPLAAVPCCAIAVHDAVLSPSSPCCPIASGPTPGTVHHDAVPCRSEVFLAVEDAVLSLPSPCCTIAVQDAVLSPPSPCCTIAVHDTVLSPSSHCCPIASGPMPSALHARESRTPSTTQNPGRRHAGD